MNETMNEAIERMNAEPLTVDEFEELVVKPIRAAYRDKFFLGEKYAYDYWYKFLKHANRTKLDCAVECWVHRHSELPVLADIAKSLEL